MRHRVQAAGGRFHGIGLAVAACLTAAAMAGCGGGTSASQLLKDTFSGSHKITSATVDVDLTVTPSGSSTLTSPITLSFSGPFQDLGKGRAPNSDFTLSLGSLDRSLLSIGLESLDGKGYINLGGSSYPLPASEYQQLESRLTHAGSGSGSTSGILGKLGIDPLRWLVDPTVAGTGTIGGASTTQISAGLNMGALLDDVGTFLGKASSLGVPDAGDISTSISPATKAKILAEVRRPSVEIWTGTDDQTLRKLALSVTIPVTGGLSGQLGGLKSAVLSLDVLYQNLNRPQSIIAPTDVKPYSQFESRVQTLITAIRGAVSGSLEGSSVAGTSGAASAGSTAGGSAPTAAGSTAAPSGTGESGSSGGVPSAYAQCVGAAGDDYAKMYKCAPLLSGSH
jgi:hypothetical protein